MQSIEYRSDDKSNWLSGEWQDEPDKKQWQDPATGLPCLAVRGPHGAWCGYVGVPDTHPWHSVEYSTCAEPSRHESHEGDENDWHYSCTPSGIVEVHGGLTFSGKCADLSPEAWERMRSQVEGRIAEAEKYPRGDSARWLRDWRPTFDNYSAWREKMHATTICHVPGEGEPDNVWWFGFDCAHSGDFCDMRGEPYSNPRWDDIYRDLAYVESEVTRLAEQLHRAAY